MADSHGSAVEIQNLDWAVRDVTDAEVAFYRANGWVKLPKLIAPELAQEILRHAKELVGENAERAARTADPQHPSPYDHLAPVLRNYLGPNRKDPYLRRLAQSPSMGRVASRLCRGEPIRFLDDEFLVKPPASEGSRPTPWHQDFPHTFFDRSALTNIWIALVGLPPERGPMRFLSGSHRAGPLGRTLQDPELDLVAEHPDLLDEFEISPPLHLESGDATVHTDLTAHSGPPNLSDAPRWAYLVNLFRADARYTGAVTHSEAIEGVPVDGRFETARYPLVWPPEARG